MTHRPTSSHTTTVRRTLLALAAAASLAIGLGTGCMDPGEEDDGVVQAAINCNGLKAWAVGKTFNAGDVITFDNFGKDAVKPFKTTRQIRVDAFDWTPLNLPGFWESAGSCGGALPPPVTPPAPPPPVTPPAPPPPAPPPAAGGNTGFDAFKCLAQTGTNGGVFDAAGDFENVGNGAGKQFITGRCLSNADCGSGCCAKPCGICSGPAVGAVAGKTGCGFDINNPFAK